MNDFTEIKQVVIPKHLANETQLFLRKVGALGREGMVLWVGMPDGVQFRVTTLLIPKQRGVKTADGVCVIVDEDEMHRINVELFKSQLRLIAQVHSHPTEAYHSDTDDAYAIATVAGSVSIVVPDFATGRFKVDDCAVYRLAQNGAWEHVTPRRARDLLVVENS